jgi:hypothetical protein
MPVVGEMWHSRAKEVAESRQGVLGVANVLVQALARLREALIRGLGLETLPPIVDLVGQYRHRLAGEDATGRRDAPPASRVEDAGGMGRSRQWLGAVPAARIWAACQSLPPAG